jgi:hypothetical protein
VKIPFEQWLASQQLDDAARDLFREAVQCYRVGAYRAAFLLSYLGLMKNLADRVAAASMPTHISQKYWDQIQNALADDERWEGKINDLLQQQTPTNIFQINDDLRQQIRFWRGRRNDCAHARDNPVEQAHVEALWIFIRANTAKLVVAGGLQATLQRIEYCLGRPLHSTLDWRLIAQEAKEAVRFDQREQFFSALLDVTLKESKRFGWQGASEFEDRFNDLIEEFFCLNDASVSRALVKTLKDENREWLTLNLVCDRPRFINEFSDDEEYLEGLLSRLTVHPGGHMEPIVVAIENDLLREEVKANLFQSILYQLQRDIGTLNVPDCEQWVRLRPHGFADASLQHMLDKSQWIGRARFLIEPVFFATYLECEQDFPDRLAAKLHHEMFKERIPPDQDPDDADDRWDETWLPGGMLDDFRSQMVSALVSNDSYVEKMRRLCSSNPSHLAEFETLVQEETSTERR